MASNVSNVEDDFSTLSLAELREECKSRGLSFVTKDGAKKLRKKLKTAVNTSMNLSTVSNLADESPESHAELSTADQTETTGSPAVTTGSPTASTGAVPKVSQKQSVVAPAADPIQTLASTSRGPMDRRSTSAIR